MLALDDEKWSLLGHAYGKADDIPEMILELREDFESERENGLFFSYLCHQNSTYSATFAAIPHIVEIAFQPNLNATNQFDIIIFCGSVHALRNHDRRYKIASDDQDLVAKLTQEIENAYLKAIGEIKPLAEKLFGNAELDDEDQKYLFFSFLAFHEQEKLSQMFFEFSELDEFVFNCQNCKNEIYLWAEDERLVAYKLDPVFVKNFDNEAIKFELLPVKIDWKDWNGEYSNEQKAKWMIFLVEKYHIEPLKQQLPYLFSQMLCPHCKQTINILDNLLKQ
jgi:hypothetical protein